MPLLHQEEIKRKRERGKYTGSKIGKLVRRENQNSRQNKGVGEREKKEKNREKENEEEEEETKGPGQGYRRQDTRNSDKKRSPRASLPEDSKGKKAATYSPALHCSTIGASGLNFSVRNGKRWNPAAITTKNNGDYRTQAKQQIHETCTSLTIKERRHMRMTHEQRPKISGN